MDYPWAKFGDFSFSRFGFFRADRQTESHTNTDKHTDAAKRITLATVVGVSNELWQSHDDRISLT